MTNTKRQFRKYIGKCVIINVRFSKETTNISRPCCHCGKFLTRFLFLFKEVIYSTDDNDYSYLLVSDWHRYVFYPKKKITKQKIIKKNHS